MRSRALFVFSGGFLLLAGEICDVLGALELVVDFEGFRRTDPSNVYVRHEGVRACLRLGQVFNRLESRSFVLFFVHVETALELMFAAGVRSV